MSETTSLPRYQDLQPTALWSFFAELAAVPRPSKKEERVRARVRALAQERGFVTRDDAAGNLLIEVPASPGHEAAPVVVLQGHLDMVCEKNAATAHDFERDPIRLVIDSDPADGRVIVRADGTTLGADNGIGLALAWAAATDSSAVHGPMEILCTVDEEMGMGGANHLAPDFFRGRTMLNLDCEDDALYVGCAGGCDLSLRWILPVAPVDPAMEFVRVSVKGLRGGHSGGDIHENRGNAVRLLTRVLTEEGVPVAGTDAARPEAGLRIVELNGGGLRNALAREANGLVAGPGGLAAALQAAAARVEAQWRAATEPNGSITVETIAAVRAPALSAADSLRVLRGINGLPHGVQAVVPEMRELVQTSNNVATVKTAATEDGRMEITTSGMARSSVMPELFDLVRQARAVGELAGAEVRAGNAYPGWKPNLASPVLQVCRRVYRERTGRDARVTAIHAGLECGIIGDRVPGMDMISFGPDIKGAHSPDERVYVESVAATWEFLRAILADLAGAKGR